MIFNLKTHISLLIFIIFSVTLVAQVALSSQQFNTPQQREAKVFQQFRVLQQDEVNLFQQFDGRYDFTAIGNTLNTGPNSCNVLTESSAELNLDPTQTIISAHLYWSGSGGDAFSQFPGDYQVTLNGISINSQRNFLLSSSNGFDFFGGYADVTEIVANNGNGLYTLSDLDLTGNIYSGSPYCAPTLDYAGWSITIIYEDPALSFLNQINLYDGLEVVDGSSQSLEITLTDLDVGTDEFSKIGFLAWEGEENIAVNESLSINGILIDDPELNPGNNPFNSTNTYTESQEFWNMDLDVYDLENIISPGDTDIDVVLTSGQDLILVNNLITFVIPANASPPIPGTPAPLFLCDVFPNDGFAEFDLTLADSEIINGQAGVVVTYHLTIGEAQFDINPLLSPFTNTITDTQTIFARLENIADGLSDVVSLDLIVIATPAITDPIGDYNLCDNDQDGTEVFDLTSKNTEIENGLPNITITYYNTETDANTETNTISTPAAYNSAGAETIWLRAVNPDGCATLGSFNLIIDTVNNYIEIPVYEQFDDLVLDGITSFYLDSQTPIITAGNSNLSVTYHETYFEADAGTNSLPSAYINDANPQTIFVRVEDSTIGCYVIFDMLLLVITPPPSLDYTFCSEDTPLEFNPPLYASASILVSDTSTENPSDTGIIGAGLGEYRLQSVVINVEGEMAQDVAFYLQPAGATTIWELGAFAGGTTGMDTAVDLVFNDTSVNNYADWTGGAPAADYYPQDGALNSALAGLNINGEWYLILQGTGTETTLVNSFCINWAMSSGTPPVFASCPVDMFVVNTLDLCSAVVNYSIPTSDDPNVTLTNDNPEACSGCTFPVGDTTVTWTATNEYGSTSSCEFVITVEDDQAPVAIADVGVTVFLDEFGDAFLDAESVLGNSTDNCAVTEYFLSNDGLFTCADVESVDVVGTVYDAEGNEGSVTFDVTVIDNTAPVIFCAGAPGVSTSGESFAGSDQPAGWEQILVEGVHPWTFGSGAMPIPGSPGFATNAAVFDDDAAGIGETNFAILVSPVYDMPADALSITASFNYALQTVGAGETFGFWVVDENGDQIPLNFYDVDTEPVASGDYDLLGFAGQSVNVAFSYDDGGNGTWGWGAGVNDLVITVETPQQPPTQITLDEDGFATVLASDLIDLAFDACGVTYSTGGPGGGACGYDNPNDGTFENGYNCSSASDFQTANDFAVPADGSFTLTEITASIFANDGIAGVDVVYHDNANGLPGEVIGEVIGATIVSQAVIGENFGFDVNEIVLSVPEFTFEGQPGAETSYWVELNVTNGTSDASVFWVVTSSSSIGEPVANFNGGWGLPDPAVDGVMTLVGTCGGGGGDSFLLDCSNLGESEVTVYVSDASGNVSSCNAVIEVFDVTAPILVCGPGDGATTVTESFDSLPTGWSLETELGDWEWTFGAPGGNAAGGTIPFDSNAAVFDDDAAGNGETNRASLLTPVWNMDGVDYVNMNYDYTFNQLGAGETFMVDVYDGANWVNIITYVDDQLEPLNSGVIDGTPLANANFQVRFTYDDAGSWGWNAGIDNFVINFAIAPETSDIIITLDENGEAMVDPYAFLSEAFDACGIEVIVADYEMFTCDDIGAPILVTVFASDASGNTSSCTGQVFVVDTMGPEFPCPDDQSIMVDPDGTHQLDEYFNGMVVTDNCNADDLGLTQDPAPGTVLGVGVWDITLTATDDYGNSTTCVFELDLTLLGTDDNELNNAISLYPNPANEQVTISNSSNIALETAMIYDLNGKLVSQINLQNMQSEKMIDVSAYATGVYMVYITGEQSSVVKRLIKE